jgi:hypothetical protein
MQINDPEFIALLEELKIKDIDTFMNLVLLSLKTHPEFAVEDDTPAEDKIRAMKRVLKHFEEREEYEDCAFLLEIQKKIEDAEKGQVSSDE